MMISKSKCTLPLLYSYLNIVIMSLLSQNTIHFNNFWEHQLPIKKFTINIIINYIYSSSNIITCIMPNSISVMATIYLTLIGLRLASWLCMCCAVLLCMEVVAWCRAAFRSVICWRSIGESRTMPPPGTEGEITPAEGVVGDEGETTPEKSFERLSYFIMYSRESICVCSIYVFLHLWLWQNINLIIYGSQFPYRNYWFLGNVYKDTWKVTVLLLHSN